MRKARSRCLSRARHPSRSVGLRVYRENGALKLRLRFTAFDRHIFESACVMAEAQSDTEKLSAKIRTLSEKWNEISRPEKR